MVRERQPYSREHPSFVLGRTKEGLRFVAMRDDEQLYYHRWWNLCIEARKIFWQSDDESLRELGQSLRITLPKIRRTVNKLLDNDFLIKFSDGRLKLRWIEELHKGFIFEDAEGGDKTVPEQGLNGCDSLKPKAQKVESKAQNPLTQSSDKTKTPEGVVGGEGCFDSLESGSRVTGSEDQGESQEGGFSAAEIYEAFPVCLRVVGIHSVSQLATKADRCKVSSERFTMLLLDKIQAVFQKAEPGEVNELAGADPVALTVTGLKGNRGLPCGNPPDWKPHCPTDGARTFFAEVMMDYKLAAGGIKQARWKEITPMTVTTELKRRKGRRAG